MNKVYCIFLLFVVVSAQEHKHNFKAPKPHSRSQTPEIRIVIDVPDRPEAPDVAHEQEEQQEKKCETKSVAITAIITALIGAAVTLAVHFSGNCK